MTAAGPLDIAHHFRRVQDPRDPRFITHLLGDILTIALCAMLSGAESFEDIAAFGRAKETWLRSLGLALPKGIPSHGTFPAIDFSLAMSSSVHPQRIDA